MSANGNGQFREDELVSRKVKVGNEWQTRVFPDRRSGRLRILHESNEHLSIQTEIVRLDPDFVVVNPCRSREPKGESSTAQEQPRPRETRDWRTRWWNWPRPGQ